MLHSNHFQLFILGYVGIMDETYYQALAFCQKSSREDGIDAALRHDGTQLSALLVPPEVGQTYQIAAQAGMSINPPFLPSTLFKYLFFLRNLIVQIQRTRSDLPFISSACEHCQITRRC